MEARNAAKYEAMFQSKVRILMQMCEDAAMITANETLGMGPGRAKTFGDKFVSTVKEIAIMTELDQKDDPEFIYTKAKLDQRLEKICGENFEPWEVRYGMK